MLTKKNKILYKRHLIGNIFKSITSLVILMMLNSSCSLFHNNNIADEVILLDSDDDSLLVEYVGDNGISYCKGLWLMANAKRDSALYSYFYGDYDHMLTFVKKMSNKTGSSPSWSAGFGGMYYLYDSILYSDIRGWMYDLSCKYDDDTDEYVRIMSMGCLNCHVDDSTGLNESYPRDSLIGKYDTIWLDYDSFVIDTI